MNITLHKKHRVLNTFVWGGLLLFGSTTIWADSLLITQPNQTQTQVVQSINAQLNQQDQAKQWGLSNEDYQHYLWLMKNTPSGKWYAQLDPAEVLALNADSQNDMMKYAQAQARNMHIRVTRELAFNRLYGEAYKQLYPNEKPIQSSSPSVSAGTGFALQSGDRIWFFTDTNTPLSSFVYQHLMKEVQKTPNTTLDIYFVGKQVNQQSIQQWAAAANIPRTMINQQVTLNYGNDRFQSITQGKGVNLPYVGVLHNQNFQPITLSSVL